MPIEALLPSWNDGSIKRAILDFVRNAADEGGRGFIAPRERIAVFDNDGTLWCEQPIPVQGLFALDRVKSLAAKDPSMRTREPFAAILAHDRAAVAKMGKRAIVELLFATHSGMTPEQFDRTARDWLASARHPRFQRPFTACAYQPMLELLALLAAHGFTSFVCSGGGVDFVRAFARDVYGIANDRVIGSSGKTRIDEAGQQVDLIKLPELDTFNDREAKALDIHRHIGRRPVFAFGNSDGDLAMLRYTAGAPGPRMCLLLHHDDAEREYAYDKDFTVSPLEAGLAEAGARGWLVSMKNDFKQVFPPKE
jgi:phosphoserine phosphatase